MQRPSLQHRLQIRKRLTCCLQWCMCAMKHHVCFIFHRPTIQSINQLLHIYPPYKVSNWGSIRESALWWQGSTIENYRALNCESRFVRKQICFGGHGQGNSAVSRVELLENVYIIGSVSHSAFVCDRRVKHFLRQCSWAFVETGERARA
jgi:hypothetical protein